MDNESNGKLVTTSLSRGQLKQRLACTNSIAKWAMGATVSLYQHHCHVGNGSRGKLVSTSLSHGQREQRLACTNIIATWAMGAPRGKLVPTLLSHGNGNKGKLVPT